MSKKKCRHVDDRLSEQMRLNVRDLPATDKSSRAIAVLLYQPCVSSATELYPGKKPALLCSALYRRRESQSRASSNISTWNSNDGNRQHSESRYAIPFRRDGNPI